jgi:hypothetical protein
MRISVIWIALLFVLFAAPTLGQGTASLAIMSSVEPQSARPGDLISAYGSNLSRDSVAAVYLTDGKTDTKMEIVEQTDTLVKFRIPPATKPGHFALMVLTNGKDARLIEEPVKITIEPETTSHN